MDYGVGTNPTSVAVGDLDSDGRLDLAVTNNGPDNVSVLRGNGNGTFVAKSSRPAVGSNPYSVAISDFDSDGKQDLAVANSGSSSVSLLRGNDTGTFALASTSTVGTYPISIAVGDLDFDGIDDLAVANTDSDNVSVLLGDGDGTFATAVNYLVETSPRSVVIGDFDSDGIDDLAVANTNSNNVSVLLGDGDGTFTEESSESPFTTGAGSNPMSLAVGDFDSDGRQDLAIANNGTAAVLVVGGNGDGTFDTLTSLGLSTGPRSVAVSDFDSNGTQDLAVATYGANRVYLRSGNGNGTFGVPPTTPSTGTGTGPISVAVGDFNSDGTHDMAVANYTSSNVSVLLNVPTGDPSPTSLSFGSAASPIPQGTVSAPQPVTIGNGGSAPLVVSGFTTGGANSGDFFTGNTTCFGEIAPGASCTVEVRFAPQAQGSRSATLNVWSNAPASTAVTLTGTAGPLPQGPAGTTGASGAAGAAGPAGATGARGKDGRIQLVTCKSVTVKVKGKKVKRKKCTTKLVSGTVKFTTKGVARASLTRGKLLYATGAVKKGELVLTAVRRVKAGRYTLNLRFRDGGKWVITRTPLTIG